ncbi:hypothetical protein BC829DRAFT_85859 [Chytridium lagenaria]|nr:hypothetical protein BC829DRAFT_85859 [Chytridium lagenaria]
MVTIQIGVLSQINSIVASSVVDFFETLLYQTEEMRSFHSLVSSLYSTLRCSINNNGAVSNENWKAFTINWLRFQALSSLPSVGYQASLSNSMISDVNLVCELSRWLDDLTDALTNNHLFNQWSTLLLSSWNISRKHSPLTVITSATLHVTDGSLKNSHLIRFTRLTRKRLHLSKNTVETCTGC